MILIFQPLNCVHGPAGLPGAILLEKQGPCYKRPWYTDEYEVSRAGNSARNAAMETSITRVQTGIERFEIVAESINI